MYADLISTDIRVDPKHLKTKFNKFIKDCRIYRKSFKSNNYKYRGKILSKFSQKNIAKKLKISLYKYRLIENSKLKVDPKLIKKLSKLFEFRISYLTFLKEARESKLIKLKVLAEALNISIEEYDKIEKGDQPIKFKQAIQICNILGLDLKDFEFKGYHIKNYYLVSKKKSPIYDHLGGIAVGIKEWKEYIPRYLDQIDQSVLN